MVKHMLRKMSATFSQSSRLDETTWPLVLCSYCSTDCCIWRFTSYPTQTVFRNISEITTMLNIELSTTVSQREHLEVHLDWASLMSDTLLLSSRSMISEGIVDLLFS